MGVLLFVEVGGQPRHWQRRTTTCAEWSIAHPLHEQSLRPCMNNPRTKHGQTGWGATAADTSHINQTVKDDLRAVKTHRIRFERTGMHCRMLKTRELFSRVSTLRRGRQRVVRARATGDRSAHTPRSHRRTSPPAPAPADGSGERCGCDHPRDTPLPSPMNVLQLRWDAKPDSASGGHSRVQTNTWNICLRRQACTPVGRQFGFPAGGHLEGSYLAAVSVRCVTTIGACEVPAFLSPSS